MNDFFSPKKSKLVGLNENTVNESVFDAWNSKPNNNKEEPVYKCCDSQIAEIYKQIINNNEKAIVVAGTGVGKTFKLFNLELEDKTAMIYIAHFRALSDKFANEYSELSHIYKWTSETPANKRDEIKKASKKIVITTLESLKLNKKHMLRGAEKKILVIDEVQLVKQSSFRAAYNEIKKLIDGWNGPVICLTATPFISDDMKRLFNYKLYDTGLKSRVNVENLYVVDFETNKGGKVAKLSALYKFLNARKDVDYDNIMIYCNDIQVQYTFARQYGFKCINAPIARNQGIDELFNEEQFYSKFITDDLGDAHNIFFTESVVAGANIKSVKGKTATVIYLDGTNDCKDAIQFASRFRSANIDIYVIFEEVKKDELQFCNIKNILKEIYRDESIIEACDSEKLASNIHTLVKTAHMNYGAIPVDMFVLPPDDTIEVETVFMLMLRKIYSIINNKIKPYHKHKTGEDLPEIVEDTIYATLFAYVEDDLSADINAYELNSCEQLVYAIYVWYLLSRDYAEPQRYNRKILRELGLDLGCYSVSKNGKKTVHLVSWLDKLALFMSDVNIKAVDILNTSAVMIYPFEYATLTEEQKKIIESLQDRPVSADRIKEAKKLIDEFDISEDDKLYIPIRADKRPLISWTDDSQLLNFESAAKIGTYIGINLAKLEEVTKHKICYIDVDTKNMTEDEIKAAEKHIERIIKLGLPVIIRRTVSGGYHIIFKSNTRIKSISGQPIELFTYEQNRNLIFNYEILYTAKLEPIDVNILWPNLYNPQPVKKSNIGNRKTNSAECNEVEWDDFKTLNQTLNNLRGLGIPIENRRAIVLQALRELLDIVNEADNRLECLCPFHSENNPSFIVYIGNELITMIDYHTSEKMIIRI
jgi:hypothetical protein